MISALYTGAVTHRRITPRAHRLRYRLFWMLLDLDEVDAIASRLRFFSRNRANLFAFHDRDYGVGGSAIEGDGASAGGGKSGNDRASRTLRQQVDDALAGVGLSLDGGPVRLLCLPRMFGYVFNPLSLYLCYRPGGERLAAIIYEVTNTFGERHRYVLPAHEQPRDVVRQTCAKQLFVSPFLDMDMTYRFRVLVRHEAVSVGIAAHDARGRPVLTAAFAGRRVELSDRALLRALVTHPLLTMMVTVGIHWQALRLWLKGVPRHAHAPSTAPAVAIEARDEQAEAATHGR